MREMTYKEQTATFEERLSAVELELQRIGGAAAGAAAGEAAAERQFTIRAHFGRVSLERKPFVVTLDGRRRTSCTLTPIRTAILLVLLMDLLERGENSETSEDNLDRVREALGRIAPEDGAKISDEAVRVALYRAGHFIQKELSDVIDENLSYNVTKGRLEVLHHGRPLTPAQIKVEITASDPIVSAILSSSLSASPFARLRRSKALFIPAGKEGQDRLQLELLDHRYPVKRTSLMYRPSIESFPPGLLHKLRLNKNRRRRQEAAARAYQAGRLSFIEVLPRSALWELIERREDGSFAHYPPGVSADDVFAHLNHFQALIRSNRDYELVLTEAFFPFYLTTFEIIRPEGAERFLLFLQQSDRDNSQQVSMFGLNDDGVFFSAHDRVIRWVFEHPSTMRGPRPVLGEIERVKAALEGGKAQKPKCTETLPDIPAGGGRMNRCGSTRIRS